MDNLLTGLDNLFYEFAACTEHNAVKEEPPKETKKGKYFDDIESLKSYFGNTFKDCAELEIELSTILELCPHKRKRIEAYQGLISTLRKEMNINLTIKSKRKR